MRRNKKGKTVPQDLFVFLVLGLLAAVLAAVVHLLYHTEYAETSTPQRLLCRRLGHRNRGDCRAQNRLPLPLTTAPAPTRRKFWIYWKKSTYQQPFFVCAQDANEAHLDKIADIAAAEATRSPCTAPATSTAKSIEVPMLSGRTSSSCARPSAPMWMPIP